MKTAPVAEVEAEFTTYLKRVQEEPVVITEDGHPVAVLVPALDDDDLERLILAYTPRFRQLLEEADKRIAQTGGLPEDEFWQLVENTTEKESHGPTTDAE